MRIILHIGMSKSGSSALQQGLSATRTELAEQGVLYPSSPVEMPTSNFLMAGIVPYDVLPRYLKHRLREDKTNVHALFEEWLHGIRNSIRTTGADTLILSSENLFQISEAAPARRLKSILRGLGGNQIDVVAYIRKPSDWYLSAAQQGLRASHSLRPAGPVEYRSVLRTYQQIVGDCIHVFAYNRCDFPDGDILHHFLQNLAPGIESKTTKQGARSVNTTISAEGMTLLHKYRKIRHWRGNGTFTKGTTRFRRAIEMAESDVGGDPRPLLKTQLKGCLDQGSPDLLWLRDRCGVAFESIDYDNISAAPWKMTPTRVEDICVVDKRRKHKLLYSTLRNWVIKRDGK